ncbi:hypothetical protein OG564_10835 [Streptomyces sp. NBC_01280]|uniref:hypothetical protein n=1 Tax=Streptomyces sp. NBC_01280 TaxID=2903810 RepID=UPI002E3786C5|nr:hypothetical protein [Streptomyces sp. NBC_01280]
MTSNHGRKGDLAALQRDAGIKRHVAIEVFAIEDPEIRQDVTDVLVADDRLKTVDDALAYLEDPNHKLLSRECGWTVAMICPECPGCGCYSGECSGYRHREFADDDTDTLGDDPDEWGHDDEEDDPGLQMAFGPDMFSEEEEETEGPGDDDGPWIAAGVPAEEYMFPDAPR